MKRPRQLTVELAVIAAALMLLVLGGTVEQSNFPPSWIQISNPANVVASTDLNALAIYYNNTLSLLATAKYANVSFYIDTFDFVNIPQRVNSAAHLANAEITSLNDSIPLAISYFANSTRLISLKQFQNATIDANAGCKEVGVANQSFLQFANVATQDLANQKVPVSLYSVGEGMVRAIIAKLNLECASLQAELSGGSSGSTPELLISSPQTEIETGGSVIVQGNLTKNSQLLGDQIVYFYFNGTFIGSIEINPSGFFTANLSIPFVYSPVGAISAFVSSNKSLSLPSVTSNTLYFSILFNGTQVIVGDPPAFYPTQSFSVSGNLSTKGGGRPVPGAPMQVTFLNETDDVSTNSSGYFDARFVIPANTSDGIYNVYARFSPSTGAFGPSYNLTSIQVVRELMSVTVQPPRLSISGFSSTISGRVETQNGTVLPNSAIVVSSPWGTFSGTSNASGDFAVTVPVPLWEFSFSRNVSVTATPAVAYVQAGRTSFPLYIFNLLWALIPGVVGGVFALGAWNFGLFSFLEKKLRARAKRGTKESSERALISSELEQKNTSLAQGITTSSEGTTERGIVSIYLEALSVALSKFSGFEISKAATIREVSYLVEQRAKGVDPSSIVLFRNISRVVEDYLYSPDFEFQKEKQAEAWLEELRILWKQSV